MNRLAERLKRLNIPVRCDAEPTGSAAGRRLRTLLKTGNAGDPLFNTAMGALFSLDRALHVYGAAISLNVCYLVAVLFNLLYSIKVSKRRRAAKESVYENQERFARKCKADRR